MRIASVARWTAATCFFLASQIEASAHPHVWVVVKSEVLFGPDGKTPTPEQLAPLAKVNVESLAEFDFFTYPKRASEKPEFGAPIDYSLEADPKNVITLHFTLPLKTPVDAKKPFSFQVYDPTYFVSFSFDKEPVLLKGAPPGCSTSTIDPNPLVADDTKKLSEAFFSNMSPGADFGMKLASRVIVACP
jgi:ABC-type uncharacterized transport system substrate-binding protein